MIVQVDSVWRKVQGRLEGEDEYENLDKVERLEVFQDHIRCSIASVSSLTVQ